MSSVSISASLRLCPILLAFLAGIHGAWGQEKVTANQMLQFYYQGTPDERQFAGTAFGALQQGTMLANSEIESRHEPPLYCAPDQLTITGGQVAQIVRQAVQDVPELGARQWSVATLLALELILPCR